jgi:dTDP-glucose 4,6-dehydratase
MERYKTSKTKVSKCLELIQSVTDRPGHDRRYAMCCEKIEKHTGWWALPSFDDGRCLLFVGT